MHRFLALCLASNLAVAADFVLVKGGLLRPGIRVDDFEMLDHPVTNAEYKQFVDDAKYPPPPHWENGRIPSGMENHPVIFVNRYHDIAAYLKWRTAKEKRIYRLPTFAEYEYAASAGKADTKYPWGNEPPQGKANYDPAGDRPQGQWRQFLKPVKSYPPNAWGLYDMAGNVWQPVNLYPDVSLGGFIFRITSPDDREGWLTGGSWARTEYYLRTGVAAYELEGIRLTDLGFRLVREPEGATHFRQQRRRIVATSAGSRAVFLSWQLLPDDPAKIGFHVYRTQHRDAAGERITERPIVDSTNFVDSTPPPPLERRRLIGGPDQPGGERRVYYRVRAVGADGKEGPPSEWAGSEPRDARSGLIAVFQPNVKQGGFVPTFGDLDGDGVFDAVFRLDNGITERSADPGVPVELEAFTSYGKSIWRRPLVRHDHCFGNANNVPVLIYDLNGDGKGEVIARLQEADNVYLAVLSGETGQVLRKTPWTPLVSDLSRSSTRVHLTVAYLDGRNPAIVTQSGLYENEIFTAYDASLKQLWQFKSFGETNGSGAHYIETADVDGDGKDEIFNGTTCLNPDGTVRWSIHRGHPDVVSIKRIVPGASGRQVYYAVENNVHAGIYVVDAGTGKILWKVNREDDERWEHAHTGWVADIWDGSPGMEMMTNRDGHTVQDTVLYSATGKLLLNPFPRGWRPVNWLGGQVREMMSGDGRRLGRFNGKEVVSVESPGPNELPPAAGGGFGGGGGCNLAADLAGDYRDEVVCTGPAPAGGPGRGGARGESAGVSRRAVYVFTNTEPINRREVTRLANREYRLWLARTIIAGYPSYFEWQQ